MTLDRMVMSGKFPEDGLKCRTLSKGDMAAYVGASDLRELKKRIDEGNTRARPIFDTMAYQMAKR